MLSEVQLIWRFNRGNPDAVREIYEGHKHELVTLAAVLLLDKAEAEDVVHDVFFGFIRSGGRFRLTGSLKGFLATCVANRARNRNKSSRQSIPNEAAVVEPAAPDHERPDSAAMFGEELKCVGRALAELPYAQREAVVLRLCSGLRFHAIARMQGVSINTVQGRYRYGLDKLKTLLDGKLAYEKDTGYFANLPANSRAGQFEAR
ncbi:MAG: RNA polymerase sigma factor [Verrucomicrobiota bacterium]|jgi:RNA polymerase sigma-70 factor (ECF subfamily)